MKHPAVNDIISAVEIAYGVEPGYALQPTNKKEVVRCRHIARYLSRMLTTDTLEYIGKKTNNVGHDTVIHSINTIEFGMKHYGDITMLMNNSLKVLEDQGFSTNPKPYPKIVRALNKAPFRYEHCRCGKFLSKEGKCKVHG